MAELDGNLYIIKLIKSQPILWDKTICSIEKKNQAWNKVAADTTIDSTLLRRRWNFLCDRFDLELRSRKEHPKKTTNFKYFNDMHFLIDHLQSSSKRADSDDNQNVGKNTDVEKLISSSTDNKCFTHEAIEFTITEDDIAYEIGTDDDFNLFKELSDDESVDVKGKHIMNQCAADAEVEGTSKKSFDETELQQLEDGSFTPPSAKKIKLEYIESASIDSAMPNKCEDTIFGELVTVMLTKMDADTKKRVKKEILNSLLS